LLVRYTRRSLCVSTGLARSPGYVSNLLNLERRFLDRL